MKYHKRLNKKGFTLAEVLITLGVIGVVAALTMPAVIANYQKKAATAKLKKVYSMISQILEKEQVVENLDSWDNSEDVLKQYFIPNFTDAKLYPAISNNGGKVMCNPNSHQYVWRNNVGISTPFLDKKTAAIKLADGTCIGLNPSPSRDVFIDINGTDNPPNMAGKDLFFFMINTDARLLPIGYNWEYSKINGTDGQACNKKAAGGGYTCAAKVIMDNWEMKKDYPW